jgi:putative DNA primase/helicase
MIPRPPSQAEIRAAAKMWGSEGAREIAQQLGHAVRVGHDWRCDCPVHGGRSLTLADGHDGKLLVKCWGGCEWGDIFPELRSLGLLAGGPVDVSPERADEFRRKREAEAKREMEQLRRRIAAARDLYRHSKDATGTPVEAWLRTRGITGPVPPALRFLLHCPHRNGKYYPAMVAPIVNVVGEQIAIHKTFLRPDGSGKAGLAKEEQRETCGPMKGGAVRLAPYRAGAELLIGEGIESTLSAMRLFGLPGWAAICAIGIEALELPDDVRRIVIAADNDLSGVGQRAALSACERWATEGRSVRILLPPSPGGDFNDVLLSAE